MNYRQTIQKYTMRNATQLDKIFKSEHYHYMQEEHYPSELKLIAYNFLRSFKEVLDDCHSYRTSMKFQYDKILPPPKKLAKEEA